LLGDDLTVGPRVGAGEALAERDPLFVLPALNPESARSWYGLVKSSCE